MMRHTNPKRCRFCSEPFNRRRYGKRLEDFTRWMKRKYCSKRCANFKKELGSRSGYAWRARQHRKTKCELCPNTNGLDVHHRDGDIANNSPKNLQTLCKGCHETALAVVETGLVLWGAYSSIYSQAVELDGFKLTKAGHRVERLKALGNAIVPQVVVEIFKAIKQANL